MIIITVPPVPEGLNTAACWRKTIRHLNYDQRGGAQVAGEWLQAADVVELPPGTLVLAVDKKTLGWDVGYRSGERYAIEDATITIHLATNEGLTTQWSRHYKHAKSAFGPTTIKRIAALLEAHPAPSAEVVVVEEAQRANHKPGDCRWCGLRLPKGAGHLVGRGEAAEVEHFRRCPSRPARNGDVCALCGRTVVARLGSTESVLVREDEGRWEIRHTASTRCTTTPMETWEEYQERTEAEQATERAQKQRLEAQRRKAADARATKKAAEQAAYEAEQARVEGLQTISRAEQELFSKNIGPGVRARLLEYSDTLQDDTTTIRWGITVGGTGNGWNGEDYDPGQSTPYTRLEDARHAYRSLQWTPAPRPNSRRHTDGDCPGPGVPHCDGCGTRYAPGGWMMASTGRACPNCYDGLADDHGPHALKYHQGW
ncbi:hypothetical protein AB0F17_62320 [Nonomuraea sp. NPDC026600]|uniref:hypothetical protein n=1 Tax=Nonomuraea sp. NPDC026600 TaxID=3155363 RepID=UPI00340D8FAB